MAYFWLRPLTPLRRLLHGQKIDPGSLQTRLTNGVVLTRHILEQVWGYDFMGHSNIIEVYVRYLRLKLEAKGESCLIQTNWDWLSCLIYCCHSGGRRFRIPITIKRVDETRQRHCCRI